jgi:hypothetical protein
MKKSSLEWEKELNCYGLGRFKSEEQLQKNECLIYDPDGWDRSPYGWEKSLNEEITRVEFIGRVMRSTCICGREWNDFLNYMRCPICGNPYRFEEEEMECCSVCVMKYNTYCDDCEDKGLTPIELDVWKKDMLEEKNKK